MLFSLVDFLTFVIRMRVGAIFIAAALIYEATLSFRYVGFDILKKNNRIFFSNYTERLEYLFFSFSLNTASLFRS